MSASPPFSDLPPSLHAERQGALALRRLVRPAKRGPKTLHGGRRPA
jgi:hypothetical protein